MRKILPRLSVLLFILFLAGMADIVLYLVFDARSEVLRALPGTRHQVVGKLPVAVENVNLLPRSEDAARESERVALLNAKVLDQKADAPGVSVRFLELRGRVWRGELIVAPEVAAGRYVVEVFPREVIDREAADREPSRVQVAVFPDAASLRASYASLSERYLGVGPWWVVSAIVPLAALLLFQAFGRAGREDAGLQARGLGPIYKLAREKDHWELLVGLGADHGVGEGDSLYLFDPKQRLVGTMTVLRVGPESAEARLGPDADVSPSHLVARTPEIPKK